MGRIDPGCPEPLGVTLATGGANVAVFSANATAIELCLFDGAGETETERVTLPERTGDVFHGFVTGIESGRRYGLRAHGPYDPGHGHRFNPSKLLVDPYARALDRRFALHSAMFGESPDGATRDDRDSAPFVPKGVVLPARVQRSIQRPRPPRSRTIVYELHVRGFTKSHPAIPEPLRGTFAGLADPAALAHLTGLGVTTVELMPVAASIDERHLAPLGLSNYWGYNPIAFMVPDPRLAPGGIDELARCVTAFHDAGLEVILDVVLNHSGEGDERGPTLCLRGLDNATYYRALESDAGRYADDAGCGNVLALDRAPVLRLALDVLRYYAEAAGIDGYRFDLATTLGRRDGGFDPSAPLLAAIAEDPVLRELKLVAEPWDVGPGGYRLGAFPASWGEWNDRYRDAVRRFWHGDAGVVGELATRIAGSSDIFAARRRRPTCSINFVAAHDGFTLADLVAFERKHNEGNGEDNRDGTDSNFSWNHGVEGPAANTAIEGARRRDVRSLLATLFVSRGTPMLAMGDELGRSQQGNNNAYAQDSTLTWVDWPAADAGLVAFVAAMTALRKAHPALTDDRWLRGEPVDASGVPDVQWRRPDGGAMSDGDWSNAEGRVLIAALYSTATAESAADHVTVALNAGNETIEVRWPEARDGYRWRRAIDTALPSGAPADSVAGNDDVLAPRSVVVLVEVTEASSTRRPSGLEPEVLDRLTRAAGIAPDWTDVEGRAHTVGDDTRRALLAAMGLGATTTGQARARLAELAARRDRRLLPRTVVVPEGTATRIPLAIGDRWRSGVGALHVRHEDGGTQCLSFTVDDLPGDSIVAVDGGTVVRRFATLPPLPAGVHTVTVEDGESSCRLVVTPSRCHLPAVLRQGGRRFGLAAHLYALRRRGDQGIGDFTTLREAGEATARAGGVIVGLNPLHALFAATRDRASPYHPSDRRFLDPIYIDVERVPDLEASPEARQVLATHAGALARLAQRPDVEYAGVWDLKRAVLAGCFDRFERRARDDPLVAEFDRFVAQGGVELRRFATFEAIAAASPGVAWPEWPEALREPEGRPVALFAERHAAAVRFALYLQWLADRQLGEAAAASSASGLAFGFCRDLAVGAAPDGAEVWSTQSMLARGVSVGAPPDPFSRAGQIWNLPPAIPDSLAADGYAAFRALLHANTRHAGALRIDHVMSIARLFWIPEGTSAGEGAYVRYPMDDLLGVLALESTRARCMIVGEDLGTVPEGFRERLAAADVLSFQPLWFQRDGAAFRAPSRYSSKAVACVSTHDLPTIAGWWNGTDIAEKHALHLLDDDAARSSEGERLADKEALAAAVRAAGLLTEETFDPRRRHDAAVTQAIHRFVGAASSALVLVQADDLAGEAMALNLPGTDRERPNWRRKVGMDANELWQTESGAAAVRDFANSRTRESGDHDGVAAPSSSPPHDP